MHYIIIGTAGHVDHGKTTLVKALTGQETDRLKEEKERGISIELGFASYQLATGQKVGLVDVPGHERFIKQMLAGVAGIDLVLLIVAADEGVMPQTKEHLDIITLLNVKKGIVVLTKTDLVDNDWLELVKEDVRELLQSTTLKDAPMIAVSGKTGAGIETLKEMIAGEIADLQDKPAEGRPRMPVDRAFSVAGFGTVVTGTLWSGTISVGDKVTIYPASLEAKIRNLQVHGQQVEQARAGQRLAINLGNISLEEVARGDVLAAAEMLTPTFRLDVELSLLPSIASPIAQRQRVRVHLGTAEVLGRINLLDREELQPGEKALAQLILEEEMVALRGDRFVIRSYSPMVTIGGGAVIDPVARKVKRYKEEVLEKMLIKLAGSPEDKLYDTVKEKPFVTIAVLAKILNYEPEMVKNTLGKMEQEKKVVFIAQGQLLVTKDWVDQCSVKAQELLSKYHQNFPLRIGIAKEELRSKLAVEITQKNFAALLDKWLEDGLLIRSGDKIALSSHRPAPSPGDEKLLKRLTQIILGGKYSPPVKKELIAELQLTEEVLEELLQYLIVMGEVIKINEDIYMADENINYFKKIIADIFKNRGEIVLGEVRDATESSRKYVLPILEYLDQVKFTKRIGDKRVLY